MLNAILRIAGNNLRNVHIEHHRTHLRRTSSQKAPKTMEKPKASLVTFRCSVSIINIFDG
jgi:hypothetical protein